VPGQIATLPLGFPTSGLNENFSFTGQPENTAPDLRNVRAHEMTSGRARGGQRPGISKYLDEQHSGSSNIQCISHIITGKAWSAVTSMGARTFTNVAVSGGNVKTFTSGVGSTYAIPGDGTGALSADAPVIHSTRHYNDIYFADGDDSVSLKYYEESTNTVTPMEADPPVGSGPEQGGALPGVACRLVVTYRNRLVWSGDNTDPHNFFASAVGAPLDYAYSPATVTETQAFVGNSGNAATIPDKINSLVPFGDDRLIFLCDHSIHQMTGDIAAGGRIDEVSDSAMGGAFGRPWCKTPNGALVFFGSKGGVYWMAPNQTPVSMTSGVIEERFRSVNLDENIVRMEWDDRQQGIYVFITKLDASASTNYFYDMRNHAWYPDVFATSAHNPVTTHVFDGDAPGDRAILLGGQDGYIRKVDMDAKSDDGVAISSYVYFGPISVGPGQSALLTELQATIANGSSDVTFELFSGASPEEAFNETIPWFSGTWAEDKNPAFRQRCHANAMWLKISNSTVGESWEMESIIARVREIGRTVQRTV